MAEHVKMLLDYVLSGRSLKTRMLQDITSHFGKVNVKYKLNSFDNRKVWFK